MASWAASGPGISCASVRPTAPGAWLDYPSGWPETRYAAKARREGRDPGDLTTIEDPTALQQIKDLVAAP